MPADQVTLDNFVRAETNRMFAGLVRQAGGINRWHHVRGPVPLDQQTVIRMNRDTLYSVAVLDLTGGAELTIPDAGDRYLSVMVVNQDHYINRVYHDAGSYRLTQAEFDTPFVVVAARVLVDANDAADVAAVNAIQDGLAVSAGGSAPFVMPNYDETSFTGLRDAVLELGRYTAGLGRTFGTKDAVDPIRHLVGTAVGWGGMPEHEALYVNVSPGLPVGEYRLNVSDVPVDAFWSISVYGADGFFAPNDRDAYNVNSVMAARNPDGSITVHFGGCADDRSNCLPISEGWDYLIRLYRPRPELLHGAWTFPAVEPVPGFA
jgi:hypothetical protein